MNCAATTDVGWPDEASDPGGGDGLIIGERDMIERAAPA
jgi:hypothetical protein